MPAHVGALRGDEEVKALLHGMRERARHLQPAFAAFGDDLRAHNLAQFATQGMQSGEAWAPLKPEYAAWKLRKVGPRPILRLFDRLYEDLTGDPMGVEEIHDDHAEFGTNQPYASFHMTGTRFMPARPPVTTTLALSAALDERIARYVTDGVA